MCHVLALVFMLGLRVSVASVHSPGVLNIFSQARISSAVESIQSTTLPKDRPVNGIRTSGTFCLVDEFTSYI